MDVRSNEPFWLIHNALPKSYPSLTESKTAEIVVIGGGITGALISHKLIKEGKKVILIDRRDICNGSSAASTSMLQYEIDVPLHQLIEQRGLTCAVSSYKSCEKAISNLAQIVKTIKSDCGFESKKSVYFCSTKKDLNFLEKEYESRKEHGFAVRWLNQTQLKKLGLKAYAAIESDSGAVMDVYKFANDLLQYTSKKGLQVFDRSSMKNITHQKDHIEITLENNIVIKADHVVHCTGYESVETLKENVVELKSTYALASEAFEKLPNAFKNHIFWNTDEPYLYFRSTADNRIIMGGGDEDFKDAKKRDELLEQKEKSLVKAFEKCFPKINYKADYSWAGTFGETKDGLPYMGKPDANKNEHYILGFGGNGITFSVMGTEVILESIEDKPHPYLDYYRFNR